MNPPDLAIFLATSGHSGVDRVMRNLLPEFVARGLRVDLLKIAGHGPHWGELPENARLVELGARHVHTALPALVHYLRQHRPRALLSDKDKVNRTALLARALAGVNTRIAVRMGTTVSVNLARRGAWSRFSQQASIRLFYRFADAIITPSQGAANDLACIAGLSPDRITVCPSPVVTAGLLKKAEEVAPHPWLAENVPVVLGVGELCARKDFSTLLHAFALLRRQRPCRLIIAGEGRQRAKLQTLAAQLNIAGDVDLAGFQPNPYAYMRHADVFALSSVCEGSPVVLMEALAVGTPVVSTDCPSGPREVLADGRYGALVPVGDGEKLAAALADALDHPPSTDLLREASLPYSVANSADHYLAALGLREAA